MWQNRSHINMSKSNKANVQEGNPIDAFFSQKLLGFEFHSTIGVYEVLVNKVTCQVKVLTPTRVLIDENIEHYFDEDVFEDDEFQLWLRSLLMSIEFFNSDIWDKTNE